MSYDSYSGLHDLLAMATTDVDDAAGTNFALSTHTASDRLLDSEDIDRFITSIERTLLFRIEWQELLYLVNMGVHSGSPGNLSSATALFDYHEPTPDLPKVFAIPANSTHVNTDQYADTCRGSRTSFVSPSPASRRATMPHDQRRRYGISDTANALVGLCSLACYVTETLANGGWLDAIIACIRALLNAGYLRILNTEWQALLGSATGSTRPSRSDTEPTGAIPSTLPTPGIPSLTTPPADVVDKVSASTAADPVWREISGLDSCYRGPYGIVTRGIGGVTYPDIMPSPQGLEYPNPCTRFESDLNCVWIHPSQLICSRHVGPSLKWIRFQRSMQQYLVARSTC